MEIQQEVFPQNRADRYPLLIRQLEAVLEGESDWVANLANAAALMHHALGYHWTGFYRVEGQELVLGPFQGPVACTRIPFGKGVCGSAWKEQRTLRVPDVELFPGHIACSALSRSELVVPIRNAAGAIWGVLDIDSALEDDFSETDQAGIEALVARLSAVL